MEGNVLNLLVLQDTGGFHQYDGLSVDDFWFFLQGNVQLRQDPFCQWGPKEKRVATAFPTGLCQCPSFIGWVYSWVHPFPILLLFHVFALGTIGTDKALLCAVHGPQSFSYQVSNKLTLWYFFGVWAVDMDYSSQKSPVSYIYLYVQVPMLIKQPTWDHAASLSLSTSSPSNSYDQVSWSAHLMMLPWWGQTFGSPLLCFMSFGRVGWMYYPVLLLLSKTWGRYLDIIFGAFPQMLAFTASCSQLWAVITDSGIIGENATQCLVRLSGKFSKRCR